MIDLNAVRTRAADIPNLFLSVQDIQSASAAIENDNALPPAAYVSVSSEVAEPNRTTGAFRQRVIVTVSILFCIPVARAADDLSDEVEAARDLVIGQFMGWIPPGGESMMQYDRYQLRAMSDGLIWGECLFRTSYRRVATA